MKEKIICAAIYFDDGENHAHQPINIEKGFVICGMRHPNCYATLAILKGKSSRLIYKHAVQGFITTDRRFLNGTEAARIAFEAGQIINWVENDKWEDIDWSTVELFSEDIY